MILVSYDDNEFDKYNQYAYKAEHSETSHEKTHLSHDMYFQQCGILTSVGSDEPAQPPVKLKNAKCCSISSLSVIEYASDKQRL